MNINMTFELQALGFTLNYEIFIPEINPQGFKKNDNMLIVFCLY